MYDIIQILSKDENLSPDVACKYLSEKSKLFEDGCASRLVSTAYLSENGRENILSIFILGENYETESFF